MTEQQNNGESTPEGSEKIPEETFEEVYMASPREIGFFRRCYRAVTDMDFYRLVAVEPWTKSLFFAVKLILLASVLISAVLLSQTLPMVSTAMDNVQDQLRPVTFTDGNIAVDGDVPHRITLVEDYEIIFDPDAELNRLELPDNVLAVFVDGGLYYRGTGQDFQFMSMRNTGTESEPLTLTGETFRSYRTTIYLVIVATNVLGAIILQFIMNAVRIGLITMGAWFLTRSGKSPLGFRSLTWMSCYVLVPIVIIDVLLTLTGVPISSLGSTFEIALLVIGSFYLYRIHDHIQPDPDHTDGDGRVA